MIRESSNVTIFLEGSCRLDASWPLDICDFCFRNFTVATTKNFKLRKLVYYVKKYGVVKRKYEYHYLHTKFVYNFECRWDMLYLEI